MYDWANSAYSTLSITLLVAYIQTMVFPPEAYGVRGKTVWAWGISLSMLIAALLSPIVGAIADAHASKRRWLAGTALLGAACAMVLSLVPTQFPWVIAALFVITSLFFELSLGVYNGFLPEICDHDSMDRVSAYGFGLGYIGGAVALVLAVAIIKFGSAWGLEDEAMAVRAGLFLMGVWWAVFSLPAILILRDRRTPQRHPLPLLQAARTALAEVVHTLRHLRAYRTLALFLLAFLFYNDGIQTVISQASTFALDELKFQTDDLMALILMVQIVATPGALAVGWMAQHLGQKPTLLLCLGVWILLLVVAYFVVTQSQFWALAVVLALVMGGTQSVSRSIMGRMTPPSHSAEFFGFFNLSGKATGFQGTFLFGLLIEFTESARHAIVSLLVFFLLGTLLVAMVNIERGRQEAAAG
jgi:UMF1 family MFS transporter